MQASIVEGRIETEHGSSVAKTTGLPHRTHIFCPFGPIKRSRARRCIHFGPRVTYQLPASNPADCHLLCGVSHARREMDVWIIAPRGDGEKEEERTGLFRSDDGE
jgi:hypothetical protein